jgi:hypothetical protein
VGKPFMLIEVEDEYGLYALADPVTRIALDGQRPLWFRRADMVRDGSNEPPA